MKRQDAEGKRVWDGDRVQRGIWPVCNAPVQMRHCSTHLITGTLVRPYADVHCLAPSGLDDCSTASTRVPLATPRPSPAPPTSPVPPLLASPRHDSIDRHLAIRDHPAHSGPPHPLPIRSRASLHAIAARMTPSRYRYGTPLCRCRLRHFWLPGTPRFART
ncbi:hypothetical protein BV25DRAFT_1605061 [Artomyces pyxidatus]|uniref:Uncharacterized protein n=1 Tax=Artomyces pyxidatus TaxID=48021 RepID=A0ACB8TBK2_9AGAM|nr:hypothetical protein BV25DRAFT_1605061 [Artomyces pyxidatus]